MLTTRSRLVCPLLTIRPMVSAMNQRTLVVTSEENIWRVQLDGVEVVSFCGPHAQQWASREREELEQLLDAQSNTEVDAQHYEDVAHTLFSWVRNTKGPNSLKGVN